MAHPLDHADKTVQWAIEIDYQKLYTASKNNLHNGMSMAQDEALLFLFAYTLVNWIRLLPPNKQGEIMGEVVVSLLLDVLVGIVVTGGAGLAVRYGAKAYSSLKNAGLLQKGVTELIALAARFAPTHIKKAQPILQMGEKALDSGAKATAKIGKGIEPSKTIENANVTARKFEKKTQLGTTNNDTKAASAGKSDANKSIESAGNTCTNNCPVSMVTGEELLTLEEGRFDGVFPFVLQRLYRSSAVETNLGMGYGWSHTLAHQLNFADGKVHWRDHEGRTIAFPEPTQQAPAITNPLAKAAIYLGRRKDEFILTQPGQPLFHFTRHGAAARLTSLTDKYRNRLLVHYNDAGELRRVELPGVHALQFYYADGLLLRVDRCVADPDTPERQWQQHVLMRYHYNAQQQLIAAENALGECERYRYDAQHVIQERRLAGGVQFFWEWEGAGKSARCVHHWSPQAGFDSRYEWQDDGSVTVINVDGSEEVYQHNDAAKLVAQTDPDGAVTAKAYDEDGHLRKETDPLGGETVYHYNRNGELEAVVAADGQVTSYEYWDGFVRKVTQGEAEWRYERNSQGDILKQTTPEGVVTRYRYSDTGQLLAVMYADGSQHQLVWNRFGQLVEEKLPQGGEVRYRYDALGRQVLTQDEHSAITRYQYDVLDRVTNVTLPGGAQRRYQYNAYGKVTHFTDEQGRTTRYEYGNQLHLVTAQHNPDGSSLQFAYNNPKLFLSDITNERGEHYQLRYYPNGLVESEVDFAGRKTGYVYDLNGKLTEKHEYSSTDDSVLLTQFTRDPMGRLLTKTLPDGSEVRYQYDESGHLTAVDDGRRPLHYAYDAAGRLVAEHQSFATLRYAYNAAGQLEKCKLPDANLLTYRYLRGGLLQGIDLNGSPLTQHDYHQGLETRRQLGALHSLSQYDEQGRLREQKVQINRPAPHAFKVQRRYHYDAAGNLSQLEDSHKGSKQFFYDPLDRLTQVKGVVDEQFSHDIAGNLLSQFAKEQNHALTEMQGNRLTFHSDCHYEYDGFGNLITEARGKNQQLITRYTYDCQHRLIKLEKHDGTIAEYQYDAFGRRIQKTVTDAETLTTKKTTFLWQANRLIAETDNQTHYRSFIYEPGSYKPLVQLEGKGKTAQVYYYHLDHLGTPQELTSPHGKLVWAVQYRAYGNVVRTIANEIDTPLRFQGQYFDAESGLHYNRHRYYQPDSGRFLTPDPIKLAGGLNNYQYVQNPVNWVDPLGLAGVKGDCPPNGTGNASTHTDVEPSIPDVNEETTRVRHYTNRKGSKGIEESGTINAHDNNRVYVEQAKNKPLNQKEAENTYQIGQGRGRDYIEFDVPTSQLEWIKNPRYGRFELTIKGHASIKNSKVIRRK